jgi:CBS domain-containing protein
VSKIREVMSKVMVTVAPAATVAEAATVMGARHVGSALVVDGEDLVGIFTERDILRALASDFDAAHHRVSDWMTKEPATIAPDSTTSEALDRMLEEGYRHLPVMDGVALIGIVSLRDLSRSGSIRDP